MALAHAILIPNPHAGLGLGIPTQLTLQPDGSPPSEFEYDGNRYVLGDGRGAGGEWVYEHRD